MNKKLLPIVAVLLLILVGGGLLFMSQRKGTTAPNSSLKTSTQTTAETEQIGGSISKDLLALGVAQKCTYSDSNQGVSVEGTSYVSGGKIRGDFKSTSSSGTTSGHMIYDGKANYIWTDENKQGFKMAVSPEDSKTTSQTQKANQEAMDFNKTYNYQCSSWLADASLFTPPSDINFMEFKAPNPSQSGSGAGSTDSTQNICGTCNSLTGDQKTQCLTALKCN